MKFRKNIMTGLIGVALMAAPITAAAQDHNNGKNSRPAQSESRSNESRGNAPAHNAAPATHNKSRDQHSARTETPRTETHAAAPANMNRNEGRDERGARRDP